MAQRPDSPTPPEVAPAPEVSPAAPDIAQDEQLVEEQIVHHVSNRKKRKKGVGGEEMSLQMTSMIDVVFLLLIYFIVTANFTIDEGTLLATMPGNSADKPPDELPDTPTSIELTTTDQGVTYTIVVGGWSSNNAADLAAFLTGRVKSGQMAVDDVVQIKPQGVVRWQHVVNVFNACVSAELESVGFAP